jgi:hypothetical protein
VEREDPAMIAEHIAELVWRGRTQGLPDGQHADISTSE